MHCTSNQTQSDTTEGQYMQTNHYDSFMTHSVGYRNFQKAGGGGTFNLCVIFCRYNVVNSPEADFCIFLPFWCILTPDIRPFYSKNVML